MLATVGYYVQCPADATKHMCCNKNCAKKSYGGDGDDDCGDGSDENGQWATCHGNTTMHARKMRGVA